MVNGHCYDIWCKGKELTAIDYLQMYFYLFGLPLAVIVIMAFIIRYLMKK